MYNRLFQFKYTVIFLFLTGLVFGQQSKTEYTLPKLKTHITIPVSIPVKEIESMINQSVGGVIYEDDSYTDNNNDQFKTLVTKEGDITILPLNNNRLMISIPLRVWASQGYGGLGYYVYQDTSFGVIMKFISSVEFKPDWTLETQTRAYGFDWTEKPVLDFKMVKIPITSIVEKRLNEQQGEFTGQIDEQIKESIDLKPYLLKVWNQFSDPMNISEEFDTWLKLTPVTLYMTPLKIYADYVQCTLGLDLYSETSVGKIPPSSPKVNKFPNYVKRETLSNVFNLQTTVSLSIERMGLMADAQFKGMEFEMAGEGKVKVEEIRVLTEKNKVRLEIETSGKIKGTSIVRGEPYYDKETQMIRLKNVKYNLKTKNAVHKVGLLFFKGKIKRMIAEEYGIPVNDLIATAKQNLIESFNKEYYPGIHLRGTVLDLKPSEIKFLEDEISVIIDTVGTLRIEVRELNLN